MLSVWTELLNMSDCEQASKRAFILRKCNRTLEIPSKVRTKIWCAFVDSIFSFEIMDLVSNIIQETITAKTLLSTCNIRKEGFTKYQEKLKFLASSLIKLDGAASEIYIVFHFLLEEMVDNSVTILNTVMQEVDLSRQMKIFVKETVESSFDNCSISQNQLFLILDHYFVFGNEFLTFFLVQIVRSGLVNDDGSLSNSKEKFNSVILYAIQRFFEVKGADTASIDTFKKENSIGITSVYNEIPRSEKIFQEEPDLSILTNSELISKNEKGSLKSSRIPIFSAKKEKSNISTEIEGDSFTKKSEAPQIRNKKNPSKVPIKNSNSRTRTSMSRSPTPNRLDSQMQADIEQLFRKYGHKKAQLMKIFNRVAGNNTITREMEEKKKMDDVKMRLMQVERMTSDLGKVVKDSIKFVTPSRNSNKR